MDNAMLVLGLASIFIAITVVLATVGVLTGERTQVSRSMAALQRMPVAAIAKQLYISQSTTKSHIARLYEKLEAGNRAHAMVNAMRLGLLPPSAEAP